MMRHRLGARAGDERGFTLIELLVVMILIGILAAIALAVFLNQQDKGRDASAKSNVTNLTHIVQACNAGTEQTEDFTNCDTAAELKDTSIPIGPEAPDETAPCADSPGAETTTPGEARVWEAQADCFGVLGVSKSGNTFWYVKHSDGSVFRDCLNHGSKGCPADGRWAG